MRCFQALLVSAMLLWTTSVSAGILYDNTIPTGAASGFGGDGVLVDDVLIPSSRDPFALPIAISSVTVGVLGFGAADLSIYSFSVAGDGTPAPNPSLIDTIPVSLTGQVQAVTFGDRSKTLLTVEPNITAQPGFGLLYIGFKGDADWVWADGPDANLPTAYLYHHNSGLIFLDTSPGPPFPTNVSYYLSIDGTPVPEPPSIIVLATAIFLLLGVPVYGGCDRGSAPRGA